MNFKLTDEMLDMAANSLLETETLIAEWRSTLEKMIPADLQGNWMGESSDRFVERLQQDLQWMNHYCEVMHVAAGRVEKLKHYQEELIRRLIALLPV